MEDELQTSECRDGTEKHPGKNSTTAATAANSPVKTEMDVSATSLSVIPCRVSLKKLDMALLETGTVNLYEISERQLFDRSASVDPLQNVSDTGFDSDDTDDAIISVANKVLESTNLPFPHRVTFGGVVNGKIESPVSTPQKSILKSRKAEDEDYFRPTADTAVCAGSSTGKIHNLRDRTCLMDGVIAKSNSTVCTLKLRSSARSRRTVNYSEFFPFTEEPELLAQRGSPYDMNADIDNNPELTTVSNPVGDDGPNERNVEPRSKRKRELPPSYLCECSVELVRMDELPMVDGTVTLTKEVVELCEKWDVVSRPSGVDKDRKTVAEVSDVTADGGSAVALYTPEQAKILRLRESLRRRGDRLDKINGKDSK